MPAWGMIELLLNGIAETLYMTLVSTALAYVIGLPLGIVLYITDKNGICRNNAVNAVLGFLSICCGPYRFLYCLWPFCRSPERLWEPQ